jgi:hypothetical protein
VKPKKPTPKTPPKTPGQLVPQPKGGAIWQGAPANPVAGPGRPASVIRAAMRDTLSLDVLPRLHADWQAEKVSTQDYADFLAKHGLTVKEEGGFSQSQAVAFVRVYEAWLDRNLSADLAFRARSEIKAQLKAEGL